MRYFRYDSPVMQLLVKIVMMIWLNLLWILCCIPVFTIGASCGGYYFATEKFIRHDHDYAATQFWRGFKSCFKQNTLLGLAALALEALMFASMYLYQKLGDLGYAIGGFGIVMLLLMVLLALYTFYLFCYLSRFESTVKNALRNVLYLFLRHFGSTLLLAAVFAVCGIVIYVFPVMLFFIPALGMYCVNRILEPVFRRYMTPEQLQREEYINRPVDKEDWKGSTRDRKEDE